MRNERKVHLKGDSLKRHKGEVVLTACGLVAAKGMKVVDDHRLVTCGSCRNSSYFRLLVED